jgi:hypothetical protein
VVSRIKQSQIALLAAEQSRPNKLAMRVLPELVFGQSNRYGAPWTGAGTEQGVLNIFARRCHFALPALAFKRADEIAGCWPSIREKVTCAHNRRFLRAFSA